jgi:hypothetical protein
VATVEPDGRPRTRILHPIWDWDGTSLTGWIMTGKTPPKVRALEHEPTVSLTYWDPAHDVATAECGATWADDVETKRAIWERFATAPAPVGYDPSIIPGWDSPASPSFSVLRLDPYRLRVMPGSVLLRGEGTTLRWSA